MDYKAAASDLILNLCQNMCPSSYDVAWMARLEQPDSKTPLWPELCEWLLEHQLPDGSWGGQIPYTHDRIICTLSAIVALGKWPSLSHRQALRYASRYVWQNVDRLCNDPMELVGFELIFPTLLSMSRSAGLTLPLHTLDYGQMKAEKLRLIPPDQLYAPNVSVIHSLEFLGREGDPGRLQKILASNGSLGNSPATTAYYLLTCGCQDEQALAYLAGMRESHAPAIYLYPFRIFELVWCLNSFVFCQTPITAFAPEAIWQSLRASLGPQGIGLDETFGIPDGDITSVTTYLLTLAGQPVDPSVLTQFEVQPQRIFRTYQYERNPSVGTNAHALEVLNWFAIEYPRHKEAIEGIGMLLLKTQKQGRWFDKWHISPYYGTAQVMRAVLQLDGRSGFPALCQNSVDWLLFTQQDDGGWGYYGVETAEETACALMALLRYHLYCPVDREALLKGRAYLERSLEAQTYPEMWIGKCLYAPYAIIRATILAALILSEEILGP